MSILGIMIFSILFVGVGGIETMVWGQHGTAINEKDDMYDSDKWDRKIEEIDRAIDAIRNTDMSDIGTIQSGQRHQQNQPNSLGSQHPCRPPELSCGGNDHNCKRLPPCSRH